MVMVQEMISPPYFLLPPLVDLVAVGLEWIGVTTDSVFVVADFSSPLSLFPPGIYFGLYIVPWIMDDLWMKSE